MDCHSFKSSKAFTLIEIIFFISLLSMIAVSVFSLHFYYRTNINAQIESVSYFHRIEHFSVNAEKYLAELKQAVPEADVVSNGSHIIIKTNGENIFLLGWINGTLTFTDNRGSATKTNLFRHDLAGFKLQVKSRTGNSRFKLKDLQYIDLQFENLDKNIGHLIFFE